MVVRCIGSANSLTPTPRIVVDALMQVLSQTSTLRLQVLVTLSIRTFKLFSEQVTTEVNPQYVPAIS